MYQATLFGYDHGAQVVNVASVPQLSPFRYPGGKTWLIPRVRRWLSSAVRQATSLRPIHVSELIEPFGGGGIVGLTAASEGLADHVTIVELDEDVAAVWQTMLDPKGSEWLAQAICDFDLTPETVEALFEGQSTTQEGRAFKTIVRNRVAHGGILAQGAGLLKFGENGRGIRSRWYPETLAKRIRCVATLRDRITFLHGDGLAVMSASASRDDVAYFLDPPYSVPGAGKRAGKRLYNHFNVDHPALFDLASEVRGDFLMTYDLAPEVQLLAERHGFQTRLIAMKNTHHARMSEMLIGPNLRWMTQQPQT